MKRLFVIFIIVVGLLAVSVYRAKEGAQQSELAIVELKKQIAFEKEELRKLKAEEAYLSHPSRIGPIAEEQLDMGPVRPEQMTGGMELQRQLTDDAVSPPPAEEGAQ